MSVSIGFHLVLFCFHLVFFFPFLFLPVFCFQKCFIFVFGEKCFWFWCSCFSFFLILFIMRREDPLSPTQPPPFSVTCLTPPRQFPVTRDSRASRDPQTQTQTQAAGAATTATAVAVLLLLCCCRQVLKCFNNPFRGNGKTLCSDLAVLSSCQPAQPSSQPAPSPPYLAHTINFLSVRGVCARGSLPSPPVIALPPPPSNQ